MFKVYVLFFLGFLLLIKGGDWFVDGATGLARRFHIPELLIGATIVSIGTTLPEVMVSATSALGGHGEIAYGNAIGSVICNTSLIAAITLAIRPGKIEKSSLYLPSIFFALAAVFYSAVAYIGGYFSRPIGIILLCGFVLYIALCTRKAVKLSKNSLEEAPAESTETEEKPVSLPVLLGKLVVGAAVIAIGADLLVDNGTLIASAWGVPESVIGLTFVALGTSLPELVTAITSLVKGHSDLSLGNIIGANLFNLVLVSGTSVTLSPFSIPMEKSLAGVNASLSVDIPLMFVVMGIMILPPLFANGKLRRWQGITLLCLYTGFLVFQFAF